MSLDVFEAFVSGYSDRLLDSQLLAVQSGYWAAYYTNSKHPKPLKQILESMVMKHVCTLKPSSSAPKPDVDVEAFLAQEERFKKKLLG